MNFTVYQTKTTPQAEFRNGKLMVRGKSVPFNEPEVYHTIQDRMKVYMEDPADKTFIDFYLSAVNARSKRWIMSVFGLFEKMSRSGIAVQVNWHYATDDDDIFELGEIVKASFQLNMNLLAETSA